MVLNVVKLLLKRYLTKYTKELKEDIMSVDKWVDVMKDKILLVAYSEKNLKKSNFLAIASLNNNVPTIEFSIKNYFKKDHPLIRELEILAAEHNLGNLYMVLIKDYKICLNQYTNEVLVKKKLSIKERLTYKAMWKKLATEYNNTKNKK